MKLKLNPILREEMKRYAESRRFYVWLAAYELLLLAVSGTGYGIALRTGWNHRMDYSGIAYVYLVLAGILGGTVLLLVPSFAAVSIASEWEDHTMELLMASPLKPVRIVAGKLLSSICLTLLFIVAGMPFLSLVFVIGGIEKRHLLELLLVFVAESVFTGSIGVYLSALSRKTDAAGIRSYLAAMGAGIGTILIVAVVYILRKNSGGHPAGVSPVSTLVLLLLVNPLVTVASLLMSHMGYTVKFEQLLNVLGTLPQGILTHWCMISVLLQLLLSAVFFVLTVRHLQHYYQ